MCLSCFYKYTDAQVINERVMRLVAMLDAAGDAAHFGFLHIYVADDNVDDWLFDRDDPDNAYMMKQYATAEPWERAIWDEMAELSEAERATAVALHGRYFG